VLTRDRLDDLVPIEPAAMEGPPGHRMGQGRHRRPEVHEGRCAGARHAHLHEAAFDLLAEHKGITLDLATIPAEDPRTYAMIRKADTLGVFQIEAARRCRCCRA
jgi:error-prone DNA polymerase